MPRPRFRVTVHNADGEFVNDALMGPHSLAMEIEYIPVGWKLTIVREQDEGEKKDGPQ